MGVGRWRGLRAAAHVKGDISADVQERVKWAFYLPAQVDGH